MRNSSDFLHLKMIVETFDWLPIVQILRKSKFSPRGRKPLFSQLDLFKAFVLKSYLLLDDNTLLVKRLGENKAYLEFCHLSMVPSHNTLSRFELVNAHNFMRVFEYLDDVLEQAGAFEHDDSSFDGTDIPVPFKNKHRPHRYHFGAKSNKKKFHGFWLMIHASVKHQVPRRFIVGYGREGQIALAKRLYQRPQIDESKTNIFIIMDGIFDFAEMHRIIITTQHKIPLIGYNKRRSGIDERSKLPRNDWHFVLNPVYQNDAFVVEEFKKRTSIERVNSHTKLYTQIIVIQNKIKKSHTIKKTIVENIVVFSFIVEQLKLLATLRIAQIQKTLNIYKH